MSRGAASSVVNAYAPILLFAAVSSLSKLDLPAFGMPIKSDVGDEAKRELKCANFSRQSPFGIL
jgi:hypothetical protein